MIYSTPKADFDGVTTGLRLLEKAVDNIALGKDQPEQKAEYLQEAANLIKDAWLSVQTAAGRALLDEVEERERQGERQCLLCQKWKPTNQMVRELAGYGSEEPGKSNTWWRCVSCQAGPQTHQGDDRDPFEEDDLP